IGGRQLEPVAARPVATSLPRRVRRSGHPPAAGRSPGGLSKEKTLRHGRGPQTRQQRTKQNPESSLGVFGPRARRVPLSCRAPPAPLKRRGPPTAARRRRRCGFRRDGARHRHGRVPPPAVVARIHRRTAATLVSTVRLLGPHALVLLQDVIPATRPFSNSGPPESPSHVFEPPRSEFQQSRRPACWSDSGQSARCTDPTSRCAICPRPSRPKP